ncbi:DUF2206 domain-containing protein [Halococcus sp. AFM35]|uniref:DUF2206 domain-containing protein n=1 Tax=Halococcus sp. AFM35 TaxID=3421653 RepID=UPI003EC11154
MKARRNWTEDLALTAMLSYLVAVVVFGVRVPGDVVFRPFVGIVLLTTVPGYLLVALLGLDDRPIGRIALYSVGASVPIVAFLAVGLSVVLPAVGVDRPLSPSTLTAAVAVLIVCLSVARAGARIPFRLSVQPLAMLALTTGPTGRLSSWVGGRRRDWDRTLSLERLSTHDWLALASVTLIPLCSAFLTAFSDTPGFESLLAVLLGVLAVVPLVLLRWRGTAMLYPYAIWAVAAAVLLQMTLVSGHLWGYDIHYEYATAANILERGAWSATVSDSSSSLVTVTLLAAVYSMVTGMDIVLVYKLVYPLVVALLPVGIWYAAGDEFGDRSLAVLAPFALVFYYGFFKDMPDKQLVAGLFAILVLVAFLDRGLSSLQRWVLGLIFAIGLVASHYGVSLLFVAFFGFTLVARHVLRAMRGIDVTARVSRPSLVGFLGGFWLLWYLVSASGVNFYRVLGVGMELLASLPFPTSERSGAAYATTGFESNYWLAYKLTYIVLLGFVAVGLASAVYTLVVERDSSSAEYARGFVFGRTGGSVADPPAEYTLLAVGVFGFLSASVVFTFGLGFDRTLQIALFVLAPFALVGARVPFSLAARLADRLSRSAVRSRVEGVPVAGLLAVFLAVLFLFSSGTVFALAGQPVPSYNINYNESAGWPVYSEQEVEATRWLDTNVPDNATVAVYNDWEQIKSRDGLLVSEVVPAGDIEPIWLSRETLDGSAYVYVSHKPIRKTGSETAYIDPRKTPFYRETLSQAETVYARENVTIYRVSANETA